VLTGCPSPGASSDEPDLAAAASRLRASITVFGTGVHAELVHWRR
jgi:hypothetical protein